MSEQQYFSRVYTDRPPYADFEPPAKFQAILSIIGRRLREHPNAICSYSGGSDSDILLDLIERARGMFELPSVRYVFFNTGLEMRATREHVRAVAEKYGVVIEERRPKTNIVMAVKKYGVPFVGKIMSMGLEGWQKKQLPLSIVDEYNAATDKRAKREELRKRYPGCQSTINFLCCCNSEGDPRPNVQIVINSSKWMLDFIREYPPDFQISAKCCDYCKKQLAHQVQKGFDMVITGERRDEGGMRSVPRDDNTALCFYQSQNGQFRLRPLFYVSNSDKEWYKRYYGIRYSDAYEIYGLKRTGCCGCPISHRATADLEMIRPFEPNLVKAAWNVFGKSYIYRQQYNEYKRRRAQAEGTGKSGDSDAFSTREGGIIVAEELVQGQAAAMQDAAQLRVIEARIAENMNGLAYNLLSIGRCLVEAKERKLVPHGEWENWVRANTGMSEERAQRLMRAARSAPEGSAMARLPVSKILALLPLPAEEREAEAVKAESEGATVAQLRSRVEELLNQKQREAERAERVLAINNQLAEAKADAERRVATLEGRLGELLGESTTVSAEAQSRIDRLTRELEAAKQELKDTQDYAARQAELRQEAQQELLNAQLGREDMPVRGFQPEELVAATQAFIGTAGTLPLMGAELSRLPTGARDTIRAQIDTLADWVQRARGAMSTQCIEV